MDIGSQSAIGENPSYSNTNDQLLDELEEEEATLLVVLVVKTNSTQFFNLNKLEDGEKASVDPTICVWGPLGNMKNKRPSFFRTHINFSIVELDAPRVLVVPVINENARSTRIPKLRSSHNMKYHRSSKDC